MNKIFALLLAVVMLFACGAAVAEQDHEEPVIDFALTMDKVPEGYTFATTENGGDIIAAVYSEDPDALIIYAAVSQSSDFEEFTFDHDLSEEELAQATAALTEDYANPTVEVRQTENGTRLIIIREDIEDGDYADMITIWHGYIFNIGLQKTTKITEEDMQLATQVVSNMWVVKK